MTDIRAETLQFPYVSGATPGFLARPEGDDHFPTGKRQPAPGIGC